jgi:hypothetical protein
MFRRCSESKTAFQSRDRQEALLRLRNSEFPLNPKSAKHPALVLTRDEVMDSLKRDHRRARDAHHSRFAD